MSAWSSGGLGPCARGGPCARWALTTPVPVRLLSVASTVVTFACLRLSLGGPRGAAVSGGRLRFVAKEEDAGGQGPFACSALTTPVLARHSVE